MLFFVLLPTQPRPKNPLKTPLKKDKKPAKQLVELVRFVKDNKIVSISRADFYDKINKINTYPEKSKEQLKMRELYPQLEKSVQKIQAVMNFYWTRGDAKQVGIAGVNPLRDLEDWMFGVIAILANVIFAGLWFLIYNGLN